jgi:tripartite-type tricarboxylate transporter receptor subunit TctC
MRRACCFVWVLTAALVMLRLVAAAAQPRADPDHGKTIHLIVGAAAGTDEDMYGRLIAKYLGQHVEGHPTVAVINRPGDAGRAAAEIIASSSNDDGTLIGTVAPQAIAAPLWSAQPPSNLRSLGYLGSASSEITECFVGESAQVDTVRDALTHNLRMAALTEGGPTRDGPNLLDQLIGMKFTVIPKYADISSILAAIGEDEVAGACGLTRSSISTRHPDWLPKGLLRSLI